MANKGFISIPFKIEGAHGGFSVVSGMAKISRAGIVLEFEAKIFGMMKTGVKEVRVPLSEIETIEVRRKFFRHSLEIWLDNFKTLNEIPNKDGRIVLQIAKDDRPRADEAVRLLEKTRLERDASEFIKSPVSRLFGEDEETKELKEE